jgi:hypothetical protein
MWSSILSENAPESLPEGSVRQRHIEDLLGLARPPRMLMDLVERCHRTVGGVERRELGQKESIDWFV